VTLVDSNSTSSLGTEGTMLKSWAFRREGGVLFIYTGMLG